MQITTGLLVIEAYGEYTKDDGEPMRRKDGSTVEYVEVRDDDTFHDGGIRRFTLDRSVNGNRTPAGQKAHLVLKDWIEQDARVSGRTGRAYIAGKRKSAVMDFVAPKA